MVSDPIKERREKTEAVLSKYPIVWWSQMDGSMEGRVLGLGLTFLLKQESCNSWVMTTYGKGWSQTKIFEREQMTRQWADEMCQSQLLTF